MTGEIVFGAAGSFLIIVGLYLLHKQRVSRNWPQGTGTITKTDLKTSNRIDYEGDRETSYSVSVCYVYKVDGVRLVGFHERTYGRIERADAEVRRYPVNASVPVYYDPENPVDVVLVRASPGYILIIVVGIVFLGFAVLSGRQA